MIDFYKESVNLLTSKEKFYIKLGLERVSAVLAAFGNPQDKLKIIHVAGTNGKGSVCSILSSVLCAAGFKTGLFTSPHLVKYNERIKINGKDISDEEFYSILSRVDEKSRELNTYLTEFEILTVAAFLFFAECKVDYAIMEVGLGGRLDATNVAKSPLLTVITSLSFDHVDRLGDSIEKIAFEKAGILKENVPCVVSGENRGFETIKKQADIRKSPIYLVDDNVAIFLEKNKNYALINGKEYDFALCGEYQSKNLALALKSIEILKSLGAVITEESIKIGLAAVNHSGRCEYLKENNLVIDGAHNPDGALELRRSLDKMFGEKRFIFVYASINTKDYEQVLRNLLKSGDKLFLYDFKRENAVCVTDITKKLPKNIKGFKILKDATDILQLAKQAKTERRIVVLTGSLYAIGELYPQIILSNR